MKLFALVTAQGTACSEACLCDAHTSERSRFEAIIEDDGPDAPVPGSWTDCSGNDALACVVCGEH